MTTVKTYVWLSPKKLEFINSHPEVLSLLYDLGLLPEEISARVRGYVEGERERCAKIAEAGDPECLNCKHDSQGCSCPDTAKLITKKIRGD